MNEFQFIYPESMLDSKKCDESYSSEYTLLKKYGFNVLLFNSFDMTLRGNLIDCPVIYRGWMLSTSEYDTLQSVVEKRNTANLYTTIDNYLECHHFPNWYDKIKHLNITANSFVVSSLDDPNATTHNNKYLIKDFVKSNTSSYGSIAANDTDLHEIVNQLIEHRGEIEGGLVFRQFENYNEQTEFRLFVFCGNVYTSDDNVFIPEFVDDILLSIQSHFYSIDIVTDEYDNCRLVEIGDGQVTGLKEWSLEQFCNIFR